MSGNTAGITSRLRRERKTALPAQDWKQSLTFHASFDKGLDADFALGDKHIYTAPDYKAQMEAKPGLDNRVTDPLEMSRAEPGLGGERDAWRPN